MDKDIFKDYFTSPKVPNWKCPTCKNGMLELDGDSLSFKQSYLSKVRCEYVSDPECIEYTFSALFLCSSSTCKECVSCSGTGGVDRVPDIDETGTPVQDWYDFFEPRYFQPPLNIIQIPEDCPSEISDPIYKAFELFFSSPSSSANCIRSALETLMDHLKIQKTRIVKRKRKRLSLHDRISLITNKHLEIKELILAIKWIGNSGSHDVEKLGKDDVLDAFELMEHVLQEAVSQKTSYLKAKAKSINKKKGV